MTFTSAALFTIVIASLLAGCASTPDPGAPMLAMTWRDADAMLDDMANDPKTLARPIVVVGGWADPGPIAAGITRQLRRALGDDAQIATVTFFGTLTFDACRERLIATVQREFGGGLDGGLVEVDVVGFSMGGIVARYAAMPSEDETVDKSGGKSGGEARLRVRRLFTIGTPHRGARLAPLMVIDPRAADMRAGSDFLAQLDAGFDDAMYDLVAYVRSGDFIVGDANAAPPNGRALIVDNPPFRLAHLGAGRDPRIIADIARRLRDEPPLPLQQAASDPDAK